jgi:hypothetical protein
LDGSGPGVEFADYWIGEVGGGAGWGGKVPCSLL